MTKEILLRTVVDLPDSFEVDEVIKRLLFVAGIEEGLKDLREGNVHSHEEIQRMVEAWRK